MSSPPQVPDNLYSTICLFWILHINGIIQYWFFVASLLHFDFPGSASGRESACECRRLRDAGSILGMGRSPGIGSDNPFQYFCLENPMDRGALWATVHGPQRVGHDWATNSSPRYMPGYVYTHVYSSIIYKSQKVKTPWMFIYPQKSG